MSHESAKPEVKLVNGEGGALYARVELDGKILYQRTGTDAREVLEAAHDFLSHWLATRAQRAHDEARLRSLKVCGEHPVVTLPLGDDPIEIVVVCSGCGEPTEPHANGVEPLCPDCFFGENAEVA